MASGWRERMASTKSFNVRSAPPVTSRREASTVVLPLPASPERVRTLLSIKPWRMPSNARCWAGERAVIIGEGRAFGLDRGNDWQRDTLSAEQVRAAEPWGSNQGNARPARNATAWRSRYRVAISKMRETEASREISSFWNLFVPPHKGLFRRVAVIGLSVGAVLSPLLPA